MNHPIPHYEGNPVVGTAIKMSGAIPMDDLEGAVIGIDDVVQLKAQIRCVAVRHEVNAKGDLVRIHVLRPFVMVPDSMDPDDPAGDFIQRALPRTVEGKVLSSRDESGEDE